jgi:hypothetical protein
LEKETEETNETKTDEQVDSSSETEWLREPLRNAWMV